MLVLVENPLDGLGIGRTHQGELREHPRLGRIEFARCDEAVTCALRGAHAAQRARA